MLHSNLYHIKKYLLELDKKTAIAAVTIEKYGDIYVNLISEIIVILDFTELDIKQLASDF